MANRLDLLVGFVISEQELWLAYEMDELEESALYPYNMMRVEQTAKVVLRAKELRRKFPKG